MSGVNPFFFSYSALFSTVFLSSMVKCPMILPYLCGKRYPKLAHLYTPNSVLKLRWGVFQKHRNLGRCIRPKKGCPQGRAPASGNSTSCSVCWSLDLRWKTSKSWKLSGTFYPLYYSPLLLLSSILSSVLLSIIRNFPRLSIQPLHFPTLHN